MPMVAPVFEKKTGIRFSRIGLKGSGAGIKTLSEDGADICGVSRSLTSDERDLKYYYLIAGYDAIVIFVNKSNRVTALSAAAVKGIFTGKIRNWKEVGGADAPIVVVTEVKGGKEPPSMSSGSWPWMGRITALPWRSINRLTASNMLERTRTP